VNCLKNLIIMSFGISLGLAAMDQPDDPGALEQGQLVMPMNSGRFRGFFPATAHVAANIISGASRTSYAWAPLLEFALSRRYGQTRPYKVGKVLLSAASIISDVQWGDYYIIPAKLVDLCNSAGYVQQTEQNIKRMMGRIPDNMMFFYNLAWPLTRVISDGIPVGHRYSKVCKIASGIFSLPGCFDSSNFVTYMDREVLFPCRRFSLFAQGWRRILEYMHPKAERLEQLLIKREVMRRRRDVGLALASAKHERLGAESPLSLLPQFLLHDINKLSQ
jgi:hypothetical protein